MNFEINTSTGVNSVRTESVNCLRMQDTKYGHKIIKIPFAYSQETIPATSQTHIAIPQIARSWKHLGEIACGHIHRCPDLKRLLAVTFRQHSSRCLSNTAAITNLGLKNTIWLDKHRSCLRFTEEQFKNCATVNRISVQSEYPQNVFTVPASNHFNRVRNVLHHEAGLDLKDVTLPQQIR